MRIKLALLTSARILIGTTQYLLAFGIDPWSPLKNKDILVIMIFVYFISQFFQGLICLLKIGRIEISYTWQFLMEQNYKILEMIYLK